MKIPIISLTVIALMLMSLINKAFASETPKTKETQTISQKNNISQIQTQL